ncbi:hypothetical protein [Prosthecobacter sp.]|uniref:hypothetical protein n=1 Tax=Prosthecobacter sp. TaxID=1965333 RepID=UPI00378313D9
MKILQLVVERPGMWGVESLRDFVIFVSGWNIARQELGLADFFDGFQSWQTKKLNSSPGLAWARNVVDYFGNDVREIRSFMSLVEEFREETKNEGSDNQQQRRERRIGGGVQKVDEQPPRRSKVRRSRA